MRFTRSFFPVIGLAALVACGSGGAGGGEGAGGSGGGNAGDLEGAWRPASVHHRVLSLAAPLDPIEETLDLPAQGTDSVLGTVEMLQVIGNGARTTYLRSPGQPSTLRFVETLTVTGDIALAGSDLLELEDGRIKVTRADAVKLADGGDSLLTTDLYFERVAGPVPPADWPTDVIDLP
jgi:hypothetical protein